MTAPAAESPLHDVFMGHAETTAGRLVELHARLLSGELTVDGFVALAAGLVGRANAQAFALADLSLAAWVTAATQSAAPTLGLVLPDEGPRLRDGLATLIAAVDPEAPELRVARYGRAETARAFQRGYSEGIAERDEIGGWRRRLNTTACQLCVWLWKEGKVYPASRRMTQHPGCGCHPEPVLR